MLVYGLGKKEKETRSQHTKGLQNTNNNTHKNNNKSINRKILKCYSVQNSVVFKFFTYNF